jgi:hypothetical protein
MELIGEYVLDTLQIYFPWDDNLYGYIKNHGFGTSKVKALPLIYTDNCESTIGISKSRRKYVINPDKYGKSYKNMGWEKTDHKSEPIIPAEKIKVYISLLDNKEFIKFKILPEKNHYHIEYSVTSAFGKMYSNWVALYLPIDSFLNIYKKLINIISYKQSDSIDLEFEEEKKQNQREEFKYISLPIRSYEFYMGEFNLIRDYLKKNGFKGVIPTLYYDSENVQCKKKMEPRIKYGILQTKNENGFKTQREPQLALKIAQEKITTLERGKRGKVKGLIRKKIGENNLIIKSKVFLKASNKLINLLETK